MKKLLLVVLLSAGISACNNLKQNDNGAKDAEPVVPASELKNDTSSIDSTRK